ncbi:alcohol oxidase [Lentinula detonsa]|uniref:Alcohol oxidase n=1 Tax=Lentinula detonsa TaxID=2804962 RepID=A0A9W8TX12_9AGAR|nr:alcohol oxidase [Lentinula detonsa]
MHKASHIINVSLPDFLQHYRRTGSPAMRNLYQSFALLTALSSVASSSAVCNVGSNDPVAFSEISLDYLVIGGGTAGLAVASRLAEDTEVQVGVIEAGTFHRDDPLIDVPVNVGLTEGNPLYDWDYTTIAQPGANGQSFAVPRGKMLGGSSGMNFLAWERASQPEYDAWGSLVQDNTWSFQGLLPYFRKAATVFPNQTNPFPGLPPNGSTAAFNPEDEGFSGPIQIAYSDLYMDPVFPFVQSLNNIGIPTLADAEAGNTTGVENSRQSVNRAQGVRSYAATTYYCRSVNQTNFHVIMNATAFRIGFQNSSDETQLLTAKSVEFTLGNDTYTANASKAVILSAGAYNTPKLLELSGIGNATRLESLGIPSLIDLPQVGENLQDHLFAPVQYQVKSGITTFDQFRINSTFAAEQAAIYNSTRAGFMAASDSAISFLPFQATTNNVDSLLQLFNQTVADSNASPLQLAQYDIQGGWIRDGTVPQMELILFSRGFVNLGPNTSYINILGGGLHLTSHGSVHINTTDALVQPVISPNWLSNDFDVAAVLEGLKFALRTGSTLPLADLIDIQTDPEPDAQSDAALIEYIRGSVETAHHPVGTAPMATRVVDASLLVYGTSNLRIVDASIMPLTVAAHLQESVYAIAEKAADIIKVQS